MRNALEAGITQSASWTQRKQLPHGARGIAAFDWSGYPIMLFQVYRHASMVLIGQPGAPFAGVAETAQGPMASIPAKALAQAMDMLRQGLPL